jgi:hypothetical protein
MNNTKNVNDVQGTDVTKIDFSGLTNFDTSKLNDKKLFYWGITEESFANTDHANNVIAEGEEGFGVTTKDIALFIDEDKRIFYHSSMQLVREVSKLSQGTPIEIEFTKMKDRSKIYTVYLLNL